MRTNRNILFTGLFLFFNIASFCQLGFSFDIKKPKPFEDRVLRSEKTDKTKFNKPRHFIQNTFTHYNYFFNANNKLNEVLTQAKLSHKDDYSQLLTFYNYTLDEVSQYKTELDSLVYKAQTAIVLHDLRNDWIDNMYLIWGAAYYLRKDFDSAYLTFQFINYAFAPKEKDGYYRYIGSKADGNVPTNIANKEKNTLPKRIFSEPPSRNDAFIWQVRTHIAREQYAEASSLISQLKNDPVFPERLRNDLEEVQALYFYQQSMWDSSALHLTNALSTAVNKNEKARWEYLIAQMYEKSNRLTDAQDFYTKVISHTTDPVLEIYARLSSIRVNKDGGDNYIDKNIEELLKMGRKDRYLDYRDIIFLMAAQMELDRKNIDAAEKLLLKSTSYNYGNSNLRNKAFLQLADISFAKKKYRQAANYYDSLQFADPSLPDPDKIQARKDVLTKIAFDMETIERQDSLQRLAGIPEDERKSFVKKLVKKLRKAQGLKDEDFRSKEGLSSSPQGGTQAELFTSTGKGEWYFYNQAARTKGSGDFKARWGNRPNVDNWRRSGAISGISGRPNRNNNNNMALPGAKQDNQPAELTFDALYDNIPLTPEKTKASNDSIQNALFDLSNLYAEQLEDCAACVETSETLRQRFPEFDKMDQVLFHLYYCYKKNGETAKSDELKKIMTEQYGKSSYTNIVETGKNPAIPKEEPEPTRLYEGIYDLFIEGNFEEAIARKKTADSLYGNGYWTPQLLYIQAVYHAKQREDSAAQSVLSQIISLHPNSTLASKAQTLMNVLSRRSIIENELANMVIEMPVEDTTVKKKEEVTVASPVIEAKAPAAKKDTGAVTKNEPKNKAVVPNKTITTKSATDSIAVKVTQPPLAGYDYNPLDKHYVIITLNKVDNVFRNEAKNAFGIYNREKYYNRQFEYSTVDIDAENKLLLIGSFDNAQDAIDYLAQAKPVANTRIMPWLKPEKYSFSIISAHNLEVLKTRPLLDEYRKFTDKYWQGKF